MIRVGVTGGIGSGKSTLCKLFARRGVSVYDSDSRARELMNENESIRSEIEALFGPKAYRDGKLDRAFIASRVFTDKSLLASLNAVVHPAVAQDFEDWATAIASFGPIGTGYVILESAILFESGFDKLVDKAITVSAPVEARVERVAAKMCGDVSIRTEEVRARMANQISDREREARADYVVYNDGTKRELEARAEELDKLLTQ